MILNNLTTLVAPNRVLRPLQKAVEKQSSVRKAGICLRFPEKYSLLDELPGLPH